MAVSSKWLLSSTIWFDTAIRQYNQTIRHAKRIFFCVNHTLQMVILAYHRLHISCNLGMNTARHGLPSTFQESLWVSFLIVSNLIMSSVSTEFSMQIRWNWSSYNQCRINNVAGVANTTGLAPRKSNDGFANYPEIWQEVMWLTDLPFPLYVCMYIPILWRFYSSCYRLVRQVSGFIAVSVSAYGTCRILYRWIWERRKVAS